MSWRTSRVAACLLSAGMLLLVAWRVQRAIRLPRAAPMGTWGEPVDGLVCRLLLEPRYTIGQPISATIEVKNTSEKTRYFYPQLEPWAVDRSHIEIIGPDGNTLPQWQKSKSNYPWSQPIEPGEVKRLEVVDLGDYFQELHPWRTYRLGVPNEMKPGKYVLKYRFRSPKLPPNFSVTQKGKPGPFAPIDEELSAKMVANQWAGEITSAPVAFELLPLSEDDLIVHEWGVFTVFNDSRYANSDRKREWNSLPSFFYRQFPRERLRWKPGAWSKPIVYFYAKPTPLHVSVKVGFGEGAPVVWWPAAADPVEESAAPERHPAKRKEPFRALTWDAWIGARVPAIGGKRTAGMGTRPLTDAVDFPLPADCWVKEARLSDATPVTVIGNVEGPAKRSFPGALDRAETERFIFYDGLVPAPDYLHCEKVESNALTLRNAAGFALGPLFVVDRRRKDAIGFACIDDKQQPLASGTVRGIEPKRIAAADWPEVGIKRVRQALLDAGLFASESDALLRIWQEHLLQADGVTAFHILPVGEYDRMLPLEIVPAPAAKPVRVGIAWHPHIEIEPELTARVADLIRQLGDDRFEVREAASKMLIEIGPPVIAALRAELTKRPSLEVRRRIDAILDRMDAADWLKLPKDASAKRR